MRIVHTLTLPRRCNSDLVYPNTEAHRKCGDYLAAQLEKFGAKVYNQHADLVAYNGTILKSRNIIGAYQPENKKRVMLCAHWDSRPYADQDEKSNHQKPIDGANDGASGVGVLLEIARQIQQQAPQVGIDLIFFDSEDYGTPDFYEGTYKPDTWCLGSQYWGRIPHVPDYKARFGILLDMVGGKNATFYYEAFSKQTANNAMKKIWKMADHSGLQQLLHQGRRRAGYRRPCVCKPVPPDSVRRYYSLRHAKQHWL